MPVKLYTDGACSGNPGPGGWGWVTDDGRKDKGGAEHTTNQRMEVQAVLEGLRLVSGEVNVVSDSTYVVKCFNDRWYEGWLKRGWKNSQKKPVANQDLWEPLIELYKTRSEEITFTWVKGHSGDHFNEIADQLAVAARDEQTGKLSAAPAAIDSVEASWPAEPALWVLGPVEIDADDRRELRSAVSGLQASNSLVVSGLRRGTELVAAEIAIEHGIPLAVVLPFVDPARNWPSADQGRFAAACDAAEWLVTLGGDSSSPGRAVEARNTWIAANVMAAIVVRDPGLAVELDEQGVSVVSLGQD